MRYIITLSLLVFSLTVCDLSLAQSGSRGFGGGGGGGVGGGGGGGSVSGGSGAFPGGSSTRSRRRRLSPLESQQLALQQLEIQRQVAQVQAERQRKQYKQTLAQLSLPQNKSANARQNRLAFEQAKNDFKSLRRRQVTPNQVGLLGQPFRLTNREIDRSKNTTNWPKALRTSEFSSKVLVLDKTIMESRITDTETATLFLGELSTLNSALNTAAANGSLKIADYANARRFITGLANEIQASNLVMQP